jgi:molybdenum cofactor biosynthesis enzyme MoaA
MKNIGLNQRDLTFPNLGETLENARRYRANKAMAYREGFEEFKKTAVPILILGKKYLAHPNINLYVDMTSACNCDCNFCIAKVNFDRKTKPIKPEWLEKALDVCATANPSIQITGGEPTLFTKELTALMEIVNARHLKRPVINTNGKNLAAISEFIKHSAIEHVNISRHHYNDIVNAKIMGYGGISSDCLANASKPIKDRVRIQCNMLNGEIDTYGEVMQFIAYCYHKLGVRNVAFAQLTPLPSGSYYDPDVINVVTQAPVNADAILERVEQDNRFEFEKYRGGVACYYEVWKFHAYEHPMTVLFKYSDNFWLEKADADPELLPDLVLHTDGTLAGSWCKDRKVLCKF